MGKVTLLSVKTIFTRKTQMEGEAYMGGIEAVGEETNEGELGSGWREKAVGAFWFVWRAFSDSYCQPAISSLVAQSEFSVTRTSEDPNHRIITQSAPRRILHQRCYSRYKENLEFSSKDRLWCTRPSTNWHRDAIVNITVIERTKDTAADADNVLTYDTLTDNLVNS